MGKRKSAVVLLNKLLRFPHNPLIAKAVKEHKRVYVVYVLDPPLYGKPGSFKHINELKFIARGLQDLDRDLREIANTRLCLFVGHSMQSSLSRMFDADSSIKTVYYDGGSSINDLRLQILLKYVGRTHTCVPFNSEDILKKTWRRSRSPFRVIEHRAYGLGIGGAKTIEQFASKVKFVNITQDSYNIAHFAEPPEIRGVATVADLVSAIKYDHALEFGGREQGLALLRNEKRVSYQTIYPFLRFGMITPYEFMNSVHFTEQDYVRYIYLRRMYETKQLHYARSMDQKISRIYRESAVYRDMNKQGGELRRIIKILQHRGIVNDDQFTQLIKGLIKLRKVTWASINSMLREYLIGYDTAVVMIMIYSIISPRWAEYNDDSLAVRYQVSGD